MKLRTWRPPIVTYRWECTECMEGDLESGADAARLAMRKARRHVQADRGESGGCVVDVVRVMASVEPADAL
jgi:hypothetical protein